MENYLQMHHSIPQGFCSVLLQIYSALCYYSSMSHTLLLTFYIYISMPFCTVICSLPYRPPWPGISFLLQLSISSSNISQKTEEIFLSTYSILSEYHFGKATPLNDRKVYTFICSQLFSCVLSPTLCKQAAQTFIPFDIRSRSFFIRLNTVQCYSKSYSEITNYNG